MDKIYKAHKHNTKFRSAASLNSISRKNYQRVAIPFEITHDNVNQSLNDEDIFNDYGFTSVSHQMEDSNVFLYELKQIIKIRQYVGKIHVCTTSD